jgi:spermidine synthase
MKPRIKLASAPTADQGEMILYQHDQDFTIIVNNHDLMHSRRHESELELARLGCAHLSGHSENRVLIGGLGMGYTLRQVLDLLDSQSQVIMVELMDCIVEWNHTFLGKLNNHPLKDPRVDLQIADIYDLLSHSRNKFDTILLDIDNGPEAISNSKNSQLYGYSGITACKQALRNKGCLGVWSAKPDKGFENLVMDCGFHIHRYRVPAHKGKNSSSHFVWIASEDKNKLPPGGSESRKQNFEKNSWQNKKKTRKHKKKQPW